MQKYLILVDSGCDISDEMKNDIPLEIIPITLEIGENHYVDDGNINLDAFLFDMENSIYSPKTAAPAPELYMQHFDKAKNIFIVSISSEISATYNNALIAKNTYQEKNPDKFIEVIDSRSASVAEALTVMYLDKLIKNGTNPHNAAVSARKYAESLQTFFVLDNLSNLKKSGRIGHLAGLLASILQIKPLMGSDGKGGIAMVKKMRGYKKAVNEMLDSIGQTPVNQLKERPLAIAHCKAKDEALDFMKRVQERYPFVEVHLTAMRATISIYANVKGILISY